MADDIFMGLQLKFVPVINNEKLMDPRISGVKGRS